LNVFDVVAPQQPQTLPIPPGVSPQQRTAAIHQLERIQRELIRRQLFADPNLWVKTRLHEQMWSGQRRILEAVARHRKVAVKSCHEVGKSFTASRVVAWWLDRDKVGDAFVVTSAPTGPQVKAILWREIKRAHAAGSLPGRVNQTEWYLPTSNGEELVAFGRKPNDYDPTSFQGIHAPRVLVVLDEACGINGPLWEAADSLIANNESKILVIGNPDDPASHFADICKPGSGWHVIEISAFDSPNFTGEAMPPRVLSQLIGHLYVEEKRKKWAPRWFWVDSEGQRCEAHLGVKCVAPEGSKIEETNPLWQSKVLGKFPERSTAGGLIPLSWIQAAQRREITPAPTDFNQLGVDVGAGGDSSCVAHQNGGRVRIIHEDQNPDTMETCGKVIELLEETGAELVNVDEIGIGKGISDRGKELLKPFVGINVGRAAFDQEHFVNLRAELYWNVRVRFEEGTIDLDELDEDTAGELLELRYKRLSNGKIQIESKEDMKKRGVPSPNRAEALMLSLARLPEEEEWVIE
jgi:hypothetical protein